MPDDPHLSREQIDALMEGTASGAVLAHCLTHLRTCRRCWKHLAWLYPGKGRALLETEGVYLPNAGRAGLPPPCADAEKVPALLAELLSWSQAKRMAKVRSQRYESLPLAEAVLDVLPAVGRNDPREAAKLSSVALRILNRLTPRESEFADPQRLYRALARAWALRANALRMNSNPQEAEEAMTTAWQWLEHAGQDAATTALLCNVQSAVSLDLRRLEQALEWAEEAEELYRRLGHSRLVARMRAVQTSILEESARTGEAILGLHSLLGEMLRRGIGEEICRAALRNLASRLAVRRRAGRAAGIAWMSPGLPPALRRWRESAWLAWAAALLASNRRAVRFRSVSRGSTEIPLDDNIES